MPEPLVRVELAPGVAAELAAGADGPPAWTLAGDLGAAGIRLVRLLSARFDDGRELAIVASRRAEDTEHGDEAVTALLRGEDGEFESAGEALLSTEYDPDGVVRRAGIELWPAGGELVLRVAGDRDGEISGDDRRRAVPMAFRIDGAAGHGRYELIASALE